MGFAIEPEEIPAPADEGFEIWSENWDSLRAFLAVETQWRVVTAGPVLIWLGLDYTAVDVVLRRRNAPEHVFEDLQEMEAAALAVFSESSHDR